MVAVGEVITGAGLQVALETTAQHGAIKVGDNSTMEID
jgi:hypothetical protein